MWYEDGIKRAGDLMQQPDGLMAARALSTGVGQGLKPPQANMTKMKD